MTARRILVVEDEAPIRQMLAFNLARAGFEVDEAEDCSTARQRIVDARPDLVLVLSGHDQALREHGYRPVTDFREPDAYGWFERVGPVSTGSRYMRPM
ncbi:MAG: hypothetical protein ACE5G3_03800, partial [Gammaproteobacteria bacterium]